MSFEVNATAPYSVRVEYSHAGPSGQFLFIANMSGPIPSPLTVNWTTYDDPCVDCYVRVSVAEQGGGNASDLSDGPFSLLARRAAIRTRLISPNGGERLSAASPGEAQVDASHFRPWAVIPARLTYSSDGGLTYPAVVNRTNLTVGVNRLLIDPLPASSCDARFRVEIEAFDGTVLDESDARVYTVGPDGCGVLKVRVLDGSGAPVPGARVEVLDPADAVVGSALSDPKGEATFLLRSNVTYRVRITYPDGTSETSDPVKLDDSAQVVFGGRRPPQPGVSPWVYLAIPGVIGLGVALALLIGGEAALLALLAPLAWLMGIKRRDELLDHFVRGQIFGWIKANPGSTYTQLRTALGAANGTLSYHLYVLERAGFIRGLRDGRWRSHFAKDVPLSSRGALVSTMQRSILDLLRENPGIWQNEPARRLGKQPQNVNYNVTQLVRSGLVRMEGWGVRKKCYLSGLAYQEVPTSASKEPEPVAALEGEHHAAGTGAGKELPKKTAGAVDRWSK